MINIYNISLSDILPESLKQDKELNTLTKAISEELKLLFNDTKQTIIHSRVDELPEDVIDFLAVEKHVDFYDKSLPLEKKRQLVKDSYQWHKHKGTKWAVEQVVSIIFKNAKVSEWFEYGGRPFYFRIETEGALVNDADVTKLVSLVNATKNERSWLENITFKRTITMNELQGSIINGYITTTINPRLENRYVRYHHDRSE